MRKFDASRRARYAVAWTTLYCCLEPEQIAIDTRTAAVQKVEGKNRGRDEMNHCDHRSPRTSWGLHNATINMPNTLQV